MHEGAGDPELPGRDLVGGHRAATVLASFGFVVAVAFLMNWLFGGEEPSAKQSDPATERSSPSFGGDELDDDARREALILAESLPPELVAAELYRAAPGPNTLRSLLAAVGGVAGLDVGTAEGAFDLVTFDPMDPDHLLASRRSSYGPAENQGANEEWRLSAGEVAQTLFAADLAHDVVHFNDDGTVAIWVNSGNTTAFASRIVTSRPAASGLSSEPVYASRSVIVDGTLFALTGSADYYSTTRHFDLLIADGGDDVAVLDSGERWAWIDNPLNDIVIAYPADDHGATMVWNASTLEPIPDHPFAGRAFQRLAISGDGRTAVGVTSNGDLHVIDPTTGATKSRFGSLDPEGIAQPITLNDEGTIAITVDWNGTVTLWWVGHDQPLAVIDGDAGPARVVPEDRAPRTSSAVEQAAQRVAIHQRATPDQPTTWQIIDTSPENWIQRACDLAGTTLTAEQRHELGLSAGPVACG